MTNPIKEDAVLRKLLQDLEGVTSKRDFTRWKASFVERFSEFLSTDGEAAANRRRNKYQEELGRFVKAVKQMEEHIQQGDLLSSERTSVKARRCLAEVQKYLSKVADLTETLIPGTGDQAREFGYTKFHMGAVLIRDGFEEYDRLSLCAEIMERLRETTCLPKVADKQFLEIMDIYVDKFDMFCDVMADLGLHSAMLRCHKLNALPDEPESEPEPEPESEQDPNDDEESLKCPLSPIKTTAIDTSFKKDDSDGRLEMTTEMTASLNLEGSGECDGNNSKTFKLGFPGVKPPDGPFIKFLSPEEYHLRKKEREEAARRKKEADEVAYKPVQKINFGLGGHYHGNKNVLNCTIQPDLADDYSSGTDSSNSSDTPKKKTKTVKKVVVKKVVKKKVLKKTPKEGGTAEKPAISKDFAKVKKVEGKTSTAETSKRDQGAAPPVKEIVEKNDDVDDDDLTMNTLSPDQKPKSKIPPSAIVDSDSSSSSEDISLAHMVDFDGIEGVKGLKASHKQ